MADTKDIKRNKISETRFVIFIPLLITAICAWFDFIFSKHEYDILSVLKMIYTYFFPSIVSIMITLIIQKAVYQNDTCGIDNARIRLSSLLLVFYGVSFITCLSQFNLIYAIVFGAFSIIYMIVTWFFCLDKEITQNNPVAEERAAAKKAINQ